MQTEPHHYAAISRYSRSLSVALGYRDPMTQFHSERVCGLALELGRHIGLDPTSLGRLEAAAIFHDIGKIGIPDYILLKPGQLDHSEREIIQQHSEAGENIITATEFEGSREVGNIIRHHHERFGGNGYPDGIVGEAIPICSRIIGIVDSYDAMAITRSYHHARAHGEIMTIIEHERGDKHDPWLLDRFITLIDNSEYRAGGD